MNSSRTKRKKVNSLEAVKVEAVEVTTRVITREETLGIREGLMEA